jgi:hypothetical protein
MSWITYGLSRANKTVNALCGEVSGADNISGAASKRGLGVTGADKGVSGSGDETINVDTKVSAICDTTSASGAQSDEKYGKRGSGKDQFQGK